MEAKRELHRVMELAAGKNRRALEILSYFRAKATDHLLTYGQVGQRTVKSESSFWSDSWPKLRNLSKEQRRKLFSTLYEEHLREQREYWRERLGKTTLQILGAWHSEHLHVLIVPLEIQHQLGIELGRPVEFMDQHPVNSSLGLTLLNKVAFVDAGKYNDFWLGLAGLRAACLSRSSAFNPSDEEKALRIQEIDELSAYLVSNAIGGIGSRIAYFEISRKEPGWANRHPRTVQEFRKSIEAGLEQHTGFPITYLEKKYRQEVIENVTTFFTISDAARVARAKKRITSTT